MTVSELLFALRDAGWHIAIHNDYKIAGDQVWKTFYLFTHPSGRFVKGEADTDKEALEKCLDQIGTPT